MDAMRRLLGGTAEAPEQPAEEIAEFVNYKDVARHGFPSNPSCMAYDDKLALFAIGTEQGSVQVYGGRHALWHEDLTVKGARSARSVSKLYFVEGRGVLIALCNDFAVYRFAIKGARLESEHVEPDDRLKTITSAAMLPQDNNLLLGTKSGNIYALNTDSLQLSEFAMLERLRCEGRALGEIQSFPMVSIIATCSWNWRTIAMVFGVGHLVIYDASTSDVLHYVHVGEDISSLDWTNAVLAIGLKSGQYKTLDSSFTLKGPPSPIFGPFPANSVKKLILGSVPRRPDEQIVVMQDGIPKASFGDKYTITAKRFSDGRMLVFDFSAPVVTMHVTQQKEGDDYFLSFLIVLTKNEMVCIDLEDSQWRTVNNQWLYPLDFQPMTSIYFCSDIEEAPWRLLRKNATGKCQSLPSYSDRLLPLRDVLKYDKKDFVDIGHATTRQVLLTGHKGGEVCVWSAGEMGMKLMYRINTIHMFEHEPSHEEMLYKSDSTEDDLYFDTSDDEPFDGTVKDSHPPFRKVGVYDPCEEDSLHLEVARLAMCRETGRIAVGGRGGHVLVYDLFDTNRENVDVKCVTVSFEGPSAEQKKAAGRQLGADDRLYTRKASFTSSPGYSLASSFSEDKEYGFAMQLEPCTSVTAVALLGRQQSLVAAATSYGYALVDFRTQTVLMKNSLLSSTADLHVIAARDEPIGRYKSLKKSLRETFRRKRKVPNPEASTTDGECSDLRPVERQIEARGANQIVNPSFLIRTLKFLSLPKSCVGYTTWTLWIGSNAGRVLCYNISDPAESDRSTEHTAKLSHEINFVHGAPIIMIDTAAVASPSKGVRDTRLLISTEEQIRSFSLPQLKSKTKYKLGSLEGFRIRYSALCTLSSEKDSSKREEFLVQVNNAGVVCIHSISNPKRRQRSKLTFYDPMGLTNLAIAPSGELFYPRVGGSDIQRSTVSYQTQKWRSPYENINIVDEQVITS